MNHDMKSTLGIATAAAAAAIFAAGVIASGKAFADDITIDSSATPGAMSRAKMQTEPYKRADLGIYNPDEWALQHNQPKQFKSSQTPAQVRAEYAANRDAVRALTAEDSGSSYFWKMRPGNGANVMGAAAR
jgi:hypothetical protein